MSAEFTTMPDDQQCREAVRIGDPAFDGVFVYGVKTTGVYCRPSCSARRPRPENLSFHASAEAASSAGFRACKRCRPDDAGHNDPQTDAVRRACLLIETSLEAPSLHAVARAAGLSPYHFHRVFRKRTGVTPRAFAAACRARRVADGLRTAPSITAAIFDAGYNSSSRFYEASNARLGMTPTALRQGGRGIEIRFAVGACSLGSVLVGMTGKGVCAILIGDDPDRLSRDLQDRFPAARLTGGDAAFDATLSKVIGFIDAPGGRFDLPLDISGTAFQQLVWQALRAIPLGRTASYAEVARAIGQPGAARAVAQACASNALAVAIPCHRVVRQDGALSGYRWGVERKRALLERERAATKCATPRASPPPDPGPCAPAPHSLRSVSR